MQIAFVNPVDPLQGKAEHIPLELCLLAQAADTQGHLVGLYDLNASRGYDIGFKLALAPWHWNLIVVAASYRQFTEVRKTIRVLRQNFSRAVILAVSDIPKVLLHLLPEVDLAFSTHLRYEVMRSVMENTYSRRWDRVPGIVYREGRSIVKSRRRAKPMNVDSYPFPSYSVLDMQAYFAHSPQPFSPESMASVKRMDVRWRWGERLNSPDYMVGQMKHLRLRYGADFFCVQDEDFLAAPGRIYNFCERMMEEELNEAVKFGVRAYPHTVGPGIVQRLKEAGCTYIMLDDIQDALSNGAANNAVDLIQQAGLSASATSKVLKDHTIDDIIQQVRFHAKYRFTPRISFCVPTAGEIEDAMDLGATEESLTLWLEDLSNGFGRASSVFDWVDIAALENLSSRGDPEILARFARDRGDKGLYRKPMPVEVQA